MLGGGKHASNHTASSTSSPRCISLCWFSQVVILFHQSEWLLLTIYAITCLDEHGKMLCAMFMGMAALPHHVEHMEPC